MNKLQMNILEWLSVAHALTQSQTSMLCVQLLKSFRVRIISFYCFTAFFFFLLLNKDLNYITIFFPFSFLRELQVDKEKEDPKESV